MADWRQIVRTRLTDLHLTPSAESELIEELAQHLEDLHGDLQGGDVSDEDAYRETLSELDDNGRRPGCGEIEQGAHLSSWNYCGSAAAGHPGGVWANA